MSRVRGGPMTARNVLVMMALSFAHDGMADSYPAQQIPQEIWDGLFAEGWVHSTSSGVPGADLETRTTPAGDRFLFEKIRALAATP